MALRIKHTHHMEHPCLCWFWPVSPCGTRPTTDTRHAQEVDPSVAPPSSKPLCLGLLPRMRHPSSFLILSSQLYCYSFLKAEHRHLQKTFPDQPTPTRFLPGCSQGFPGFPLASPRWTVMAWWLGCPIKPQARTVFTHLWIHNSSKHTAWCESNPSKCFTKSYRSNILFPIASSWYY